MVGPVGVDHLQLRQAGVAAFLLKIRHHHQEVVLLHGQGLAFPQILHPLLIHFAEAIQDRRQFRLKGSHFQAVRQVKAGLAGFHGVEQVAFGFVHILRGQIPLQHKHPRGAHQGLVAQGLHLQALGRGVRPLVKLPGQIFQGEGAGVLRQLQLPAHSVQGGLGEHRGDGGFKFRRA